MRTFNVPVLCIGNITVGGTGKTPHTELILSELKKKFKVAYLSRGYKRRTRGFILATGVSTAKDIGDEPRQVKRKFRDVIVACDADRVRGIEKLLSLAERPEVILLDDAFQHRYVKADKNIVLVDYLRPVYQDRLLPAGRLREDPKALRRADYIIVTKCPKNIQPIDRRIVTKQLKVRPYQQLFFTYMDYGEVCTLSGILGAPVIGKNATILCVTGIACPAPYVEYLKKYTADVRELTYPDHHYYSPRDIAHIEEVFDRIENKEKYIFTTEKDAVRFMEEQLPERIKENMYYIPIVPVFLNKGEQLLNELTEYVRKNKR